MRADWEEMERRQGASLEGGGKLVALGIVAMLGFLAWTQFSGRPDQAAGLVPTPSAHEAPAMPSAGSGSAPVIDTPAQRYREPPVPRTGRETYVGVYECVVNGQRVVSDRPCAPDARARTLVVDQPDPREVLRQRQIGQSAAPTDSAHYASPSAGSTASRSGSASGTSNEAACEAVDQAIDNLNARMRHRYSAAEGERLRAQWHALKRERYDLKCGR